MRALAVFVAIIALAPPAAAGARPRPDLVVRSGTISAAGGQLTGSFVVRNQGRRRARRSVVALAVGVDAAAQAVGTFRVGGLKRSRSRTVTVSAAVPSGLAGGTYPVRACADSRRRVRERSEANNCRRVGVLTVPAASAPTPVPAPSPSASPPATPASSVPTDPVPFKRGEVMTPDDLKSTYWMYVPTGYDASHRTPTPLLVWLHGCGGESAGDIYTVSPGGDQRYLAITVDGREKDCWDPGPDQAKVLDAIANVKTHFNVDPHRVVVGGYSSGGDLAYRTAFYNANTFAGLLAENTSPFRDTGSSQADSIAAASWRFNVVHLAHRQDDTYPLAGVESEVGALQDAGFPVTLIERDGTHYDQNTDPQVGELLLGHMTDDWRSP